MEKFFAKAKLSIPEKLTGIFGEEIMTEQPVSIHDGATVKEALEVFEKTRFRVLPVVDDYSRVVGAVTLEDLGNVADRHTNELLSETLMHKPLVVTERANLEEIADMMIKREEDHVFVVDRNGKIVGVIAGIDIVREIMELSSA